MNAGLAKFPSTNGKIVAGIILSFMVVGTACVLEVMGRSMNEVVLLELLGFCAAWATISYAQFSKKRETYVESPPASGDVEDSAAVDADEMLARQRGAVG